MTYITPTEAVKHFVVSKPTLYRDMDKKQTLKFEYDDRGKRKIHINELEKLYKARSSEDSVDVKKSNEVVSDQVSTLEERIRSLEREVELLEEAKEIALQDKQSLNELLSNQQKITLALEDKTQSDRKAWEKSTEQQKQIVANKETKAKEEREKIIHHNRQLKKALEKERSKTVLQKIFG